VAQDHLVRFDASVGGVVVELVPVAVVAAVVVAVVVAAEAVGV